MMKEIAIAGPAPGRPKLAEWWIRYSSSGAFRTEAASNFCPAMAVPTTVKMPEPITAPMPNEVSAMGPSVFFRRVSGLSESEISLSMDFLPKNFEASGLVFKRKVQGPDHGDHCGPASKLS